MTTSIITLDVPTALRLVRAASKIPTGQRDRLGYVLLTQDTAGVVRIRATNGHMGLDLSLLTQDRPKADAEVILPVGALHDIAQMLRANKKYKDTLLTLRYCVRPKRSNVASATVRSRAFGATSTQCWRVTDDHVWTGAVRDIFRTMAQNHAAPDRRPSMKYAGINPRYMTATAQAFECVRTSTSSGLKVSVPCTGDNQGDAAFVFQSELGGAAGGTFIMVVMGMRIG